MLSSRLSYHFELAVEIQINILYASLARAGAEFIIRIKILLLKLGGYR